MPDPHCVGEEQPGREKPKTTLRKNLLMQDLNCLATFPSEYYWTFPQAQEAPLSANISLAEAEAGAETARQWMQMKNAGRSLGEIPIQIFLWMIPPAVTSIKPFRIRLQRRQVRWILRTRLGEERRPLLLLGCRQEEMDRRWRLLSETGQSSGFCHLGRHQRLCLGGVEENRLKIC